MAEVNVIAYNIAAFVSTLLLLEFGADKFIDHNAIVARRTMHGSIESCDRATYGWRRMGRGKKMSIILMKFVADDFFTARSRDRVPCKRPLIAVNRQHYRLINLEHLRRLFSRLAVL